MELPTSSKVLCAKPLCRDLGPQDQNVGNYPYKAVHEACFYGKWRLLSCFVAFRYYISLTEYHGESLSLLGTTVSPNYMLSVRDLSVLADT